MFAIEHLDIPKHWKNVLWTAKTKVELFGRTFSTAAAQSTPSVCGVKLWPS